VTENAVLYALSTLAQTCAALAALVGALCLYRIQALHANKATAERDLRGLAAQAHLIGADVAQIAPITEIIEVVTNAPPNPGNPKIAAAKAALKTWNESPSIRPSRNGLILFEAWNLLLIGVSLAGFNYVPWLMVWPWMFCTLWAAAVGTVAVTGYCVYAWTRG
jgi:hypothetical protein